MGILARQYSRWSRSLSDLKGDARCLPREAESEEQTMLMIRV